jgi:hypothetical protein
MDCKISLQGGVKIIYSIRAAMRYSAPSQDS